MGEDGQPISLEKGFPQEEVQGRFYGSFKSLSRPWQRGYLRPKQKGSVYRKSINTIRRPKSIAPRSWLQGHKMRWSGEVEEEAGEDYSITRMYMQPRLLLGPSGHLESTRSTELFQTIAPHGDN